MGNYATVCKNESKSIRRKVTGLMQAQQRRFCELLRLRNSAFPHSGNDRKAFKAVDFQSSTACTPHTYVLRLNSCTLRAQDDFRGAYRRLWKARPARDRFRCFIQKSPHPAG